MAALRTWLVCWHSCRSGAFSQQKLAMNERPDWSQTKGICKLLYTKLLLGGGLHAGHLFMSMHKDWLEPLLTCWLT